MYYSRSYWAAMLATTALLTAPCGLVRGETFNYVGPIGAGQTWESDPNWLGDAGEFVDLYPGQTLTTDNANASLDLGGNALGIDIAGTIGVATLTLGDTNAAPSATSIGGAGTLSAGTINSVGTAGAVNTIDVDLLMNSGTNNLGGGNGLTFNGDVTLAGGGSKSFRNQVDQTITYNGAISLSDGGSAGILFFRNDTDGGVQFLNGVISDGAIANGIVRYARGTFHNTVDNTYTSRTELGQNSPNSASTNIIYTDGALSTGRIDFTGGSAIKTIAGAAGFGDRTLANEIRLSQLGRFAGPENINLTGKVYQSNGRSLINDIDAGKSLTISGTLFTDALGSDQKGRTFVFNGAGLTNISAVIDDQDGDATANKGAVRKIGTGRVVFQTPGMAAYNRGTEVFDGVLQLGTGGAPVNLNGAAAVGTPTGALTVGTLEINHSGVLNFDTSLSYNLPVNHVGAGTTTLSDPSFGSGQIKVSAGTVLIDGGAFAGSSLNASRTAPGGDTSIFSLFVGDTSGLHVGQQVSGAPADPTATTTLPAGLYIAEIFDATTFALSSNIGSTNGTDPFLGNSWNLDFNAGTGTGSANVIVDAGATVGGSGVIGGFLGANGTVAPGNSIGTLTVNGNATINAGFDVEYDGAGAGSIDLLAVSGNLSLGANSILDFDAIGAPADDAAYVFATYGGVLSGSFGSILNTPTGYVVKYAFGGNNIALVAVPEPGAFCLLAVALAPLALRRRKR